MKKRKNISMQQLVYKPNTEVSCHARSHILALPQHSGRGTGECQINWAVENKNKRGARGRGAESNQLSLLWFMARFPIKRVSCTMTTAQFIAKYLPAYNKEVFHFFHFKEFGLLQGRKCNYRTIITSKCKKGGRMWVVVRGGRGV